MEPVLMAILWVAPLFSNNAQWCDAPYKIPIAYRSSSLNFNWGHKIELTNAVAASTINVRSGFSRITVSTSPRFHTAVLKDGFQTSVTCWLLTLKVWDRSQLLGQIDGKWTNYLWACEIWRSIEGAAAMLLDVVQKASKWVARYYKFSFQRNASPNLSEWSS